MNAEAHTNGAGDSPVTAGSDRYKWIALSNTTLGILMAVINQSIVIIALPAIFRGIHSTRSSPPTRAICCGCCSGSWS